MQITRTIVSNQILTVIEARTGSKIPPESHDKPIVELCRLDSLDHLELIMDIEDRYDIDIPDEEFYKLVSVNDYINFVVETILYNGGDTGIDSDSKGEIRHAENGSNS